ncbi:hypothetical protein CAUPRSCDRAFT_12035 [Caulochytrium protostelioides]|uniref:Uncharacterized protein n=1 Tax=Caulochytrium protostelioides TaxID=1555241 RepID=A0A4P9WSN7_9FUNG|nr:hypothetical protein CAUPRSCDRAFT_12035 [Caulochytrium protostelioides]
MPGPDDEAQPQGGVDREEDEARDDVPEEAGNAQAVAGVAAAHAVGGEGVVDAGEHEGEDRSDGVPREASCAALQEQLAECRRRIEPAHHAIDRDRGHEGAEEQQHDDMAGDAGARVDEVEGVAADDADVLADDVQERPHEQQAAEGHVGEGRVLPGRMVGDPRHPAAELRNHALARRQQHHGGRHSDQSGRRAADRPDRRQRRPGIGIARQIEPAEGADKDRELDDDNDGDSDGAAARVAVPREPAVHALARSASDRRRCEDQLLVAGVPRDVHGEAHDRR